jgi:tyrosine-protein kinase Etk/Wzc
MANKKFSQEKDTNLIKVLMFKYFPYWPLFALLSFIFLGIAWFYIKNVPPYFKITSSILINDQNKGLYDPKMAESFNMYKVSKLVENETEVLHSRPLAKEVANNLNLYAPMCEKGLIWSKSAYLTSPVAVKLADPDRSFNLTKDSGEIYFKYKEATNEVVINGKSYKLNKWVESPYGTLMFIKNPKQIAETNKELFFYAVPAKEAVADLLEQLEVAQTTRFSSVVDMTFYDEVPERGEDILNEWMKAYDRQTMNAKNKMVNNTVAFIEDRVRNAQREVDSLESRIKEYKASQGIVDLSEQGNLFLKNVSENDQKIANLNMQMAVLDQVEEYVQSKDNKTGIVPSTLGVDDVTLSKLLEKLYDKEMQYEKLKKTTAENNPILLSLNDEIEKTRPGILESVRNQRLALKASRNNLNKTNVLSASVLRTIPEKERALLEINRQQAIKNEVYTFLLQKREETALTLSQSELDSKVVDNAEAAVKPESPKKKITCIAALGLALVLGIGLINAKEFFSTKVLFRSEIEEATSVPIVAEIAKVNSKKPFVVNNVKNVFIGEQFRQLRAAIGLHDRNKSKKKILVTSSISGEGKSFVSNNLALSLAASGKKVVLIDLDLRNPQTTSIFEGREPGSKKPGRQGYIAAASRKGIEQNQQEATVAESGSSYKGEVLKLESGLGVTEYLRDNLEPYEVIKKTTFDNLYIVPAGAIAVNPTELLLNGKLDSLFNYLDSAFDFIIADTSPTDPVTDPYVLSDYFDTTVYVVRHNHTPKQMLDMLDESYKIKALKDIAIVFNGVKSRGFMSKGFGLGYGYGYENVYKNRVYTGRV